MGFVRKVGRKIDKEILQPIKHTVEAILDDPKKIAMVALSVFAPGVGTALGTAMGLTGTAATIVGNVAVNTALNGGDVKAAILAAAIPVVGNELAGAASASFIDAGMDVALAESAGKVVSNAGLAAAQGKDPLTALISGGLSEGTAAITRDIPGFSDLPDAAKRSITAAVATELSGGDGTQAAINAAISTGVNALTNYTSSKDDVIDNLKSAGLTENVGPGYYDEINNKFVPDPLGGMQGPLGPETGNFDPNQKWEYSLTRPGVWSNDAGEEINLSYMPDRDTAMTGKELLDKAGVAPGSLKTVAKPATPGSKIPGAVGSALAGTAGALGTAGVNALPGMAQQQTSNADLLNFLSSQDKGANIKSYKELFGEDLFGGKYVPPSASGDQSEGPANYGRRDESSTASQSEAEEQLFRGGHVDDFDADALLQILRS